MIKPAFLLKLAFPFHTTDCSIYRVLKIGTTGLFGCRVFSPSSCTMMFVPILLSRKQLPIYRVLKIGTTGLFGCRVFSPSSCTMMFVPILLSRKQLPPIVFVSHTEGISCQYGRHSMTDCS